MSRHFSLPSLLRLKNETTAVQAALLAPVAIAGAALLAGWLWRNTRRQERGAAGDWLARLVTGLDVDASRHEVLGFVRDTLLGLDKRAVRKLLGAPAAAADGGTIVAEPETARQRLADHWYYRLDRQGRTDLGAALMVAFDEHDRAADARFLLPPRR